MSVAGDMSPAVNEAARRLVEDHLIPMVVAAGNSQENACLMSPASSPWVLSVAAADDQDRRWAKSNWWVERYRRGMVVTWVLLMLMLLVHCRNHPLLLRPVASCVHAVATTTRLSKH